MQVTLILIVINVIVQMIYYLIFRGGELNFYSIFGLNFLSFDGFYWQILTSMFVHGDFLHLFMNMAVLYQFGQILEKFLGWWRFSLLYFIGGIATSALSLTYVYYMYQKGSFVNIVGASGAICVLIGFLAFLNKKETKGYFIAILVISFVPMLAGVQIAWYSHIFGFGIGYLYGYLRYAR